MRIYSIMQARSCPIMESVWTLSRNVILIFGLIEAHYRPSIDKSWQFISESKKAEKISENI